MSLRKKLKEKRYGNLSSFLLKSNSYYFKEFILTQDTNPTYCLTSWDCIQFNVLGENKTRDLTGLVFGTVLTESWKINKSCSKYLCDRIKLKESNKIKDTFHKSIPDDMWFIDYFEPNAELNMNLWIIWRLFLILNLKSQF